MALARGEKDYLGFVQGLHTEANPLAAPEGTTSDELNMELNLEKGTRSRRLGLESFSGDKTFAPADYSTNPFVVMNTQGAYYWEAEGRYVTVTRYSKSDDGIASTIRIHDASYNTEFEFTVDTPDDVKPSFVEIRSRLVVTLGTAPVLIERSNGTFNVYIINLYIRDFTLVDDDLMLGQRPGVLSNEHKYNLYNAGWYKDRVLNSTGAKGDPISEFYTAQSLYPSNADIVYLGDVVDGGSGLEKFTPAALDNIDIGSTEAPRGHYVYNIRDITRSGKLVSKADDGALSSSVTQVILDGSDTGAGTGSGGSVWDDPPLPPGTYLP